MTDIERSGTRSWRRSGGLWGGGWSLCCRGRGCGVGSHPSAKCAEGWGRSTGAASSRMALRLETCGRVAGGGGRRRRVSMGLARALDLDRPEPAPDAVRSSSRMRWRSWPPRSRRRECCNRSWCGPAGFAGSQRSGRWRTVGPAVTPPEGVPRETTLHPDSGRAAFSRVEDGGEDDDPGDREAGLGAAGGGDDAGGEPAAAGPECLDQAQAFAKLSTDFKLTQEDIGKRVGVSREQVSNYLRLLKLPPEVQVALRKKELTYSHARLLLALEDDDPDHESGADGDRQEDVGGAAARTGDGQSHLPQEIPRSAEAGRSAVGGSECEGGSSGRWRRCWG